MKYRLAILTSHPIHYQAPLWRLLAAHPQLAVKVFFQNDTGLCPYHDPEFGKTIEWDVPLIEGYDHQLLRSPWQLLRFMRRDRYDALFVHAWNSPGIWLAVIAAKVLGVRTLLRGESPWNQEAGRKGFKAFAKKAALRSFFALIDRFLYIGEENRQFYLHYGVPAAKLFFTPYAIENERFFADAERVRPSRADRRAELGLPPDAPVFLAVGKLIEKKRHMDLLRAYERCAAPRKALIIVGEGELRPVLERYIAEHRLQNVHLAGFMGQTKLAPYYSVADVFVLPSGAGETWGLVANEAMCFGLPLIVSDMVGSAADLVHPGRNGYTFPLGDVEALAVAMDGLALDESRRAAFGRESLTMVKGYSYEADVAGIIKAIELS